MRKPYRIVIASHRRKRLGLIRSLVNKEVQALGKRAKRFEVFSIRRPRRAMKALSSGTVLLVLEFEFSTSAGKWMAAKMMSRAMKLNKRLAIVVLTKPKDKRLYDKEQPIAYLAMGKSGSTAKRFRKDFREQLNAVLKSPQKFLKR